MIYIPIPSEGALVYYYYYYYYFIIILSQNLCVRYLIGERNNQKKKSFTRLCFFQALWLRPQSFFPPIAGDGVFFDMPSLNVYLRISCIFFFFPEILNK